MASPAAAAAPAARRPNRAEDRSGLFDDRFLKTLEHLHMVSRKVFSGNLRAERRTRKVGSGIEFADHRTYARGDDFRYIDWNLYGRLDKLLLRLFEEEEDLYIYLLIDVSDSMAIGNPLPKLHYAMQVGAALAYVGLANLDRVALIPFAGRLIDRLREASPKLHGDLALVDCETGDTREVTVSKSLLEAYEREHEKYCKELEAYCTKYALPFFRTHTQIPFDELVLRIFRSGGFLR